LNDAFTAKAARQTYLPYRATLISRAELARLHRLKPARTAQDTLINWLIIVAAWSVVAWWPTWWVVALAMPIVGTRFYALFIIGHDGLHRRLFDSVRANDWWNDVFVLGPIGAITRLNRLNHIRHHHELATPSDPDRYKYAAFARSSRSEYVLGLTGLPFVFRALRNVFFASPAGVISSDAQPSLRYRLRDVLIIVAWQTALIGGLSLAIGWWAYPLLFLVPVYAFAFVMDMVRVFCEHSAMTDDATADSTLRLVSFRSSPVERQFFAPHNMNHHIPHHLWPGIPYYNLPEADELIRRSLQLDDALVWRDSYLRHLVAYWRWLGPADRVMQKA
jgi:fatty acid desaturase